MATPVAVPKDTRTEEHGVTHGRAPYSRVAAVGLLLAAAAPAVMLTAGRLTGMDLGEEGPFLATTIAAPLIGAALAWRFGWWAKLLSAVLSVGVGFMLFWTVFGLAYPASFADFIPGVLLPLGVVVGLAGSIAALVAHRRGRRVTSATSGERRILTVALTLATLAVVVSGVSSVLGRSTVDASGDAVPVTIADFAFAEGTYEVAAGEPTTMLVHNSDAFVHTFTVPELGIDETVLPGNEVAVTLTADAGSYTLYCKPHADVTEPDPEQAGMAATVIAQ